MFGIKKAISCAAALAAMAAAPRVVEAQDAVVFEPAILRNGGFDGPMSMVRPGADQTPFWFVSGSTTTYKYQGPASAPFGPLAAPSDPVSSKKTADLITDLPLNPDGENSNWPRFNAWMTNIYKVNDKELLAFVHIEDQHPDIDGHNGEEFKIGLAYSFDAGATFKYAGTILDENASNRGHNIRGTPFLIIKDPADGKDYFYAYFNDLVTLPNGALEDTISVARAPVADVVSRAGNYNVGPIVSGKMTSIWKKFYKGTFDRNGLGGPSTSINAPLWVNAHTDISYDTLAKRYVWVMPMDDDNDLGHGGTGVVMLFSSDGLNWMGRTHLYTSPSSRWSGSYASFGATVDTDDIGYQIGKDAFYYFRRCTKSSDCKTFDTTGGRVGFYAATPLASEGFNAVALDATPTGWSVYESAGNTARVKAAPQRTRTFINYDDEPDREDLSSTFNRALRFTDTRTDSEVSAVKAFTATTDSVTVDFRFRLDDRGSYQAFRLKGNGKTVDAVRLLAVNGKLFWYDTNDVRTELQGITLQANHWYSLKIRANVPSNSYSVFFEGSQSPATFPLGGLWWAEIPFANQVDKLDAVAFNSGSSGTGDLWIEDVEVYRTAWPTPVPPR